MMAGGGAAIPVNYVRCQNNTRCVCMTGYISSNAPPYTLSAWANIDAAQPSLSEGRMLCMTGVKGSSSTVQGLEVGYVIDNGIPKIRCGFIQSGTTSIVDVPYDGVGTWHMITATVTTAQCNTYIDGSLIGQTGVTNYAGVTSARLGLCSLRWQRNGVISGGPIGCYANLAYWGRVLSQSEILALAQGGIAFAPVDAEHKYDMQIVDGKITDTGSAGGWDFTTITDFTGGTFAPGTAMGGG